MEIIKKFKEDVFVSNLGNVYKNDTPFNKKYKKGYAGTIRIKSVDYVVARIVLELFEKTPLTENWRVFRKDGDIKNDKLDNLIIKIIHKTKQPINKKKIAKYEFNSLEEFKTLNENSLYEISSLGNVKLKGQSNFQCCRWENCKNNTPIISLGKKNYNLAKLMLSNFSKSVPKKYVAFKDYDRENCNINNLEWTDYQPLDKNKLNRSPLLEGEIFKLCEILENRYEVSNKGNIRHVRGGTNRVLKTTQYGYKNCTLDLEGKKPSLFTHRLVMMTFNPVEDMDKKQVNHINHDRSDNRLENLEWVSPSDNNHHRRLQKSYTTTDIVGISTDNRGSYRVKLNLGRFNSFEEAEKALKEAYLKLNIKHKYLDRRVTDTSRS